MRKRLTFKMAGCAGYTLPYILHRLIEDVIFPSYAKLVRSP